jgi:hypothetical protein
MGQTGNALRKSVGDLVVSVHFEDQEGDRRITLIWILGGENRILLQQYSIIIIIIIIILQCIGHSRPFPIQKFNF